MIQDIESTTKHYKKLVKILGTENLKLKVDNPYDFINLANRGVNAKVISNFRNYFKIPRDSTANMLNISTPTLYRWIKSNKNLERNLSVQLFEITDLFLYGSEVFGKQSSFFKWLDLPNTALGGMEPRVLIEIPGGISKIKDILGRIEHGVYS